MHQHRLYGIFSRTSPWSLSTFHVGGNNYLKEICTDKYQSRGANSHRGIPPIRHSASVNVQSVQQHDEHRNTVQKERGVVENIVHSK